MHRCEPDDSVFESDGCGPAITVCYEDKDGYLWCDNGEYATCVNFCPFCGYKAHQQIYWRSNNEE